MDILTAFFSSSLPQEPAIMPVEAVVIVGTDHARVFGGDLHREDMYDTRPRPGATHRTRGVDAMKTIGIILIVAGSIALIYGGFSYTKNREVVDLGPLEITTSEQKTFPVPAVVGAAALIGGIVLLVSGMRRARSL
jgi:hypothetical protein